MISDTMLGRPATLLAGVACASLALAGCGSPAPTGAPAPTAVTPPRSTSTPATPSGSSHRPQPSPSPRRPANPGGLTDRQMVGQLFMTYVYGSGADVATPTQQAANLALYQAPTPAAVVRRWHLGGVILIDHNPLDLERPDLSTGNVGSATQIARLDAGLQRAARANGDPVMLVATDEEGGRVQRITSGVDPRPSQESIAGQSAASLTCGYQRLGSQLRSLGVNQDFAPVADVVRTSTGVIGDRSFGPDPQRDARDVAAAVLGLQRGGVLATLKHWPGHGSTSTDSHAALAVVTEDARTWRLVDRVPFAAAARTAAAVMVGHLAVPALDPSGAPATFSPILTGRLLRKDLGYPGLVVTDSLWMAPARHEGTPGQTALRALRAGNDLLLEPPALPSSYAAVLAAIRHRPGVRALVRAAVSYVLAAKAKVAHSSATRPEC